MIRILVTLAFTIVAQIALAQEKPALPSEASGRQIRIDHGIFFTLPEGWVENSREEDDGYQYISLECISENCQQSLETCHIVLFGKRIEGQDDSARLASLYDSPIARYFRMRSAIISTSLDAQLRQTLTIQRIGPRDWWVIETDARHNMKSGLFADTVIDGWRVRFTCKTCERGTIRHQSALQILKSVTMNNPS